MRHIRPAARRKVDAGVEAVGEAGGVGDHQERRIGVADEAQEKVEHGVAGRLVEVAGRLVGEDQFRPGGEGAADGDALLLAAGELFGVAGEEGRKAQECQRVARV